MNYQVGDLLSDRTLKTTYLVLEVNDEEYVLSSPKFNHIIRWKHDSLETSRDIKKVN